MLEFCKKVITNISFDRELYKKELKKAIGWVEKEDLPTLKKWCTEEHGHIYQDIIDKAFESIPAA